jgi:hypothetical protein
LPSAAGGRNQILFEQEEAKVAEKSDGVRSTIDSVSSASSCSQNSARLAKILSVSITNHFHCHASFLEVLETPSGFARPRVPIMLEFAPHGKIPKIQWSRCSAAVTRLTLPPPFAHVHKVCGGIDIVRFSLIMSDRQCPNNVRQCSIAKMR